MEDRSKLAKMFEDLYQIGYIEKEFKVFGRSWKMHSLSDVEQVWRDRFVPMGISSDVLSAKMVPTLAVAIKEIDGLSIQEALKTSQTDSKREEDVSEKILKEVIRLADNDFTYANELRKYLGRLSKQIILKLYECYLEIEREENDVLKTLNESVSEEKKK